MSLYPIRIIARDDAVGQPLHEITNGGLAAVPLSIAADQAIKVTVLHAAPTQDHSLRCFLSDRPGGNAVGTAPVSAIYWHANRVPNEPVIVATEGAAPDDGTPVIVVPPGDYYLNVLNLVNTANVFSLTLVEV